MFGVFMSRSTLCPSASLFFPLEIEENSGGGSMFLALLAVIVMVILMLYIFFHKTTIARGKEEL